ncbi:MAG: PilZ domain-containing protein [Magnetococcales bacterium]|nr:PilZ domain-containing protein [Magnetococcales bacterium]
MSKGDIREILKNSDLLMDGREISKIVAVAITGDQPLEIRLEDGQGPFSSHLLKSVKGRRGKPDLLQISPLDPWPGKKRIRPGKSVDVRLFMGGYALISRLTLLEGEDKGGRESPLQLSFPTFFRVEAPRQVSRYPVPGQFPCTVILTDSDNTPIKGILQDINQEGVSFSLAMGELELRQGDETVLTIQPQEPNQTECRLSGRVLFAREEDEPDESSGKKWMRYSLRIGEIEDEQAFERLFANIKLFAEERFGKSVLTANSYINAVAI